MGQAKKRLKSVVKLSDKGTGKKIKSRNAALQKAFNASGGGKKKKKGD